jgi:hypothetical protein
MRRILALLVALAVLAGCSDDGGTPSPTSVGAANEVPAAVRKFVARVAEPGAVSFRATYHVVKSLGGETDVEVVASPPSWLVRAGDFVVVGGPRPATCRVQERHCEPGIQEQLLEPIGVFSRFFADSPARALEADARRLGAGRLLLSGRTVAGVALRCAAVPIQGVPAATYCLTPDGVFGFVENTAVRYELTSYEPGDPGEDADPPYPVS